jgi:hypothetical protein
MIRHKLLILFVSGTIVLAETFCVAPSARGDEPPVPPPLKLTIHPADAPQPSLKYQLLPEFNTRIPGNAAVYYGKATAEFSNFFGNREFRDKIEDFHKAPLDQLRKDEVTITWGAFEEILARAARCESCDWQLPVHGDNYYGMPLPEAQQARQFARILVSTARIHIARGEFDDALHTFQAGFALLRNVAEGETIVNGLVSIAINSMLVEEVTTFIQQPASPNLYWALSMLPSPIVSLRKGVEAEMYACRASFPELRDLEAKHTPDEWRQLISRFWQKVLDLSGDKDLQAKGAETMVSANLKEYSAAKQNLIAHGMSTDVVEAMPAAQVVLIHTWRSFDEMRDDIFKWFFLPYVDGIAGLKAAGAEIDGDDLDSAQLLVKFFLPAVRAVRLAEVRSQRDIAMLRLIEALRIYGASHDCRLPETLADVTEVPLPLDPMTRLPFAYRRNGDAALVDCLPLPGRPSVYEIRMEPK